MEAAGSSKDRSLSVNYTEAFNLDSQGLWEPQISSEKEEISWKATKFMGRDRRACEDMNQTQ